MQQKNMLAKGTINHSNDKRPKRFQTSNLDFMDENNNDSEQTNPGLAHYGQGAGTEQTDEYQQKFVG